MVDGKVSATRRRLLEGIGVTGVGLAGGCLRLQSQADTSTTAQESKSESNSTTADASSPYGTFPTYQNDTRNRGRFDATENVTAEPSIRWQYDLGAPLTVPPSVHNGVVVTMTDDWYVTALDIESGERLWGKRSSSLDHAVSRGDIKPHTPTIDGSQVYARSGNNLEALDLASGDNLWTYPSERDLFLDAVPVPGSDRVIAVRYPSTGPLMATELSATYGDMGWEVNLDSELTEEWKLGDTTLGIDPPNVFFAGAEKSVAIQLSRTSDTDEYVWTCDHYTMDERVHAPVVGEDNLYFGYSNISRVEGGVVVVRRSNGRVVQTETSLNPVFGSPLLDDDGSLYLSTLETVHSLNAELGEEWTADAPASMASAPVMDADSLYVATTEGHVRSLDKETGEVNWTVTVDGGIRSSPVVINNLVIVGTKEGTLYGLSKDSAG